jgi:glycosyltransferase involved in cell wall biosynthesis
MSHGNLLSVLLYGLESAKFKSPAEGCWKGETRSFDIHCFLTDEDLEKQIVKYSPDAIITVGKNIQLTKLPNCTVEIRKKWVHFDQFDAEAIGRAAIATYLRNCFENFGRENTPLVSVFTPTYNIGRTIHRAYNSLVCQTYPNWEWILFDDSTDNGKTFRALNEISQEDPRVSVYKSNLNSGIIGEMKYRCCALSKGEILVEFDHDDELARNGLEYVVKAFKQYPEAGFAYTDWAEVFDTGGNAHYGDTWGFGYGSYRKEIYWGRELLVTNSCHQNPLTIRHIVSVPNHIRAWRRETYFEIGGHNRNIHVVDDYEIVLRSFLHTRMVHIPKIGYIQYYNRLPGSGNTQDERRKEIQRLVRHFRNHYNQAIHERFLELGVNDFVWDENIPDKINWGADRPEVEEHCTLIADV